MYRRQTVKRLALGLAALLVAFHMAACSTSLGDDRSGRWQVLSETNTSHAISFNSLVFFDESNGLGLTALGLESTTDGGKNWTLRLENGGTRGFYAMSFSDQQSGWILGTERIPAAPDASSSVQSVKPLMLKTNDGGTTWLTVNLNDLSSSGGAGFKVFHSMCVDPLGKAWIVGDAGIVEGAIESDRLRTISFKGTSRALNSVACDDTQQVWAVGDGGLIMRYQQQKWHSTEYANGGASFMRVKVVGPEVWLAGGEPRKGQVGYDGLLVSSSNGHDWENRTPSASEILYDMEFKGSEGWVVGGGGGIFHTRNAGLNWTRMMSPTTSDLMAIFVRDERAGWIGGDKLTVLGLKPRLPR